MATAANVVITSPLTNGSLDFEPQRECTLQTNDPKMGVAVLGVTLINAQVWVWLCEGVELGVLVGSMERNVHTYKNCVCTCL